MPGITGLIMLCIIKIYERRKNKKVISEPRKEPTLKLVKVKDINWNGDYGQYK